MRLGAEYITIVLQQVIVASHNTTGGKAPYVHLRWKLYNDACSCTYSGDLGVGFLTQKIDHNVDQSLSKDSLYNTLMSLTNINLLHSYCYGSWVLRKGCCSKALTSTAVYILLHKYKLNIH